ncbi:MAG: hypothetical protein Q9168_006645 [Polycauliona sp. 1 TL-2023]
MGAFFGNVSASHTTSWIPEPNGRGTWSLLSTCIITVSLCVWSAVHLNVPQHHKPGSHYWRKTKWLLLGIFAPELLAYVAWQQRQEASQLCRAVRKSYGQEELPSHFEKMQNSLRFVLRIRPAPEGAAPALQDPESGHNRSPKQRGPTHSPTSRALQLPPQHPRWKLVHGFYALMGGFTMITRREGVQAAPDMPQPAFESFLPNNISRATLTTDGLQFLLHHEPEAVPRITAEEIRDKSKADGLKKTLVCAQALWFCFQCLTRLAQSLPISLLELNTFGHALCTLAIYIFWWDKPLDIGEPTAIDNSELDPIFSYMWMSSAVSAKGYCGQDMPDGLKDEFHCIWPFEEPCLKDLSIKRKAPDNSIYYRRLCKSYQDTSKTRWMDTKAQRDLYDGDEKLVSTTKRPAYISPIHKIKYRVRCLLFGTQPVPGRPAGLGVRTTAISHISPTDLTRWAHALHAIFRYDLESDLCRRHQRASNGRFFNRTLGVRIPFLGSLQNTGLNPRLELRARNAVPSLTPSGLLPGFAIAGALYGGLHLVAWSAPLSSPLEELLWRIAGASVTCTGLVYGLLALMAKTDFCKQSLLDAIKIVTRKPLDASFSKGKKVGRYSSALGMGALFGIVLPCLPLLWILYLASRVYLVVESLKNVAYLPPGSFETPVWPAYFPHIT